MKAFIPAAGLGTRLHPLTQNKPKALVEINGKALLDHVIEFLISSGIKEFVINIHHFPDLMINHINSWNHSGISVEISDERDLLMDTGGGIFKAQAFLEDSEPFLVYNVDILSNIDIHRMMEHHRNADPMVTLATRNRDTSRSLMISKDDLLCGWYNHATGERKVCFEDDFKELAFSGIHIISQRIWDEDNFKNPLQPFSIIDLYLDMAKRGIKLQSHLHNEDYWLDLGRIEQISAAESFLRELK